MALLPAPLTGTTSVAFTPFVPPAVTAGVSPPAKVPLPSWFASPAPRAAVKVPSVVISAMT